MDWNRLFKTGMRKLCADFERNPCQRCEGTGKQYMEPHGEVACSDCMGHGFDNYQGWTNWDTWNAALMVDNDYEQYQQARKFTDPFDFRDWAIANVVGPYNNQRIQDARKWNETPYEERPDPHSTGNPQADEIAQNLWRVFEPDYDPRADTSAENDLIDHEKINWWEIWKHMQDE